MARKSRPTNRMSEVARRAGVSLSTVSRALSGSPLISEKTRRRVQEAADKLDYRVDAAGSTLRTGLTRTVGVIIPLSHAAKQSFSDPFFLEILGALADELAARDYSMLLHKVTSDPTEWISTLARGRRADGVIVVGQSTHHEALNRVASLGFPLVVWGARQASQRYVTVGSDNVEGARIATAHLLAQGCRRIVFLGDPAAPEVAARLEGFGLALKAAGIPRDSRLELPVSFGSDAAYHAVGALLDARYPFDGVVACSDVFAVSAMRALNEHERRVPADVAVVGFDDIPLAAYASPPLTTVRQDCHAGARLLVETLMRALRDERIESTLIPTELVVRASSLRDHYRSLPSINAARRTTAASDRERKSRNR